jgi:hypothetical protein
LTVFCPLLVELLSDRQFSLAVILVAMLCDSVKSVIVKTENKFFISIAFAVVFTIDPFFPELHLLENTSGQAEEEEEEIGRLQVGRQQL